MRRREKEKRGRRDRRRGGVPEVLRTLQVNLCQVGEDSESVGFVTNPLERLTQQSQHQHHGVSNIIQMIIYILGAREYSSGVKVEGGELAHLTLVPHAEILLVG